MLKTIKNHLTKSCKKTLSLILSLAVIFSFVAPTALAAVTVDDNSMKITLSYSPGCLQIDSNGKIYVGDWSNGYLYRYNADGNLDTYWGNSGKANGVNIYGTVGMCLDNTGNIIVAGQGTNIVYRVNKDTGAVMSSVSVSGPLGCNIDADGNIYVAAHSGIYKYDSNFNLLKSTTLFKEVFGIAVNSDGKIYITTNQSNKVFRLNSDLSLDTTFGTGGSVVVFNANYADNLLIEGGKLYTSSEMDNACYSLNLDGTNVTKIITGTGPTQVIITEDSYAVPFWGGSYIQIFKRPKIDLKNDNFSFTMNPLKVTEGSNTPINFTIESTSTENYTVKAQLINKLTGSVVSGVSSTTATLQDGDATVTLTPPAEGWTKGIYGIQMIFSNTVGSITLSDMLDIGISMGVGYYAINYNAPSNGTISDKTEYVEITPDAQATFTVDPDSGYSLDTTNTTVTNADVEFDGNQGTVKNITGDVNVHVAFTDVPTPTNITGVPTSWTNQDQTISFSFDTDPASVTVVGSVSGNKTVIKSGSTYSFVATQNEIYTVSVSNGASTCSTDIDVAKIDKVTPIVSVSHTPEDLTKATESDVVFTLSNAALNASGVIYYVQKDSGEFAVISGNTYTVAAPDSSTYKFKAISGAGSESTVTSGYTVNSIKPEYTPIAVNTNSYSEGSWTSSDVTLSLSGGLDASTFEKYQYSTNNSDWFDVTGSSVTVNSNFNDKYYFRVVAKSGSTGSTTTGTNVKVDKVTDFTITATGDTTSICQNNTVTLNIAGVGASGLTKVEIQKDGGTWTDITSSYTSGYNVTSNGSYLFRVTNGAGVKVTSTASLVYEKIDTAVPTVSIAANGYTENTWTNQNVTIDIINGNSENLGTATYQYSADGGKTYVPFNGNLVVSSDTDITYLFKVTSQSGVESLPATFSVKQDITTPTGTIVIGSNSWKEFLNTITFCLFFKETATVTVTGADTSSGVQKIEYYKSATALTLDEVKEITSWTTYDKAISETPVDAKSFVYYVKLTDIAGNVQYISSDGVTFDTTPPTIDSITNGATYYVDQTVTVSDTNLNTITVNGNPFESGASLPADTDATYVIVVTDKSGNSLTYTVYTKTISSIDDSIETITVDNVKHGDKAAIEGVLAIVNNTISTANNGATSSQIDALNAIKDSITLRLNRANVVSDAITDVDIKTAGITADNSKSSDKADLDDALTTVNDLLNNKTGNLTESEKTTLEQKKSVIQDALAQIGDLAKKANETVSSIENITLNNVKKTDQAVLEKALNDLNTILTDYSNNITDDEKNSLNDTIKAVQEIINSLNQVKTVEEQINKLPGADKVTKGDANNIGTVSKTFDELTDHQETLVDSVLVTNLGDVKTALSKLLLEDSATGIKLEGVDGTTLDVSTELIVAPIMDTLNNNKKSLFAINVSNASGGQEIAQLYDIHLLLDGQKIQPDGKVKITLKITDEIKDYTDLQVVYIADNGDVTIIPCERHGDELAFYTDHFSNYGIIGTPRNMPNTGDEFPLLYLAIAGGIALLLLVIAVKKKHSNGISMKS